MRPKEEICSTFLITGFLILTVTAKWIFLKRLLFITLSLKMMIKLSAAMSAMMIMTIMMIVIAMTATMTIMMTNVIVKIAMMIFTTSDFASHPE